MSVDIKQLEQVIVDYLSNINFKSNEFDLNKIERDLTNVCGVRPSVTIKWDVQKKINELKKDSGMKDYIERIEIPSAIDIVLVNENNTPIKMNFLL